MILETAVQDGKVMQDLELESQTIAKDAVELPSSTAFSRIKWIPFLALLLWGCTAAPPPFEPHITFTPPQSLITSLPTAFDPLTKEEVQLLWGKELYLGTRFAEEGDYYRAITAFKSALFLLPKKANRRQQVEFYLVLSYYIAQKYPDTLEIYENSSLTDLDPSFPTRKELLLAIWDSYHQTCQLEKAEYILQQLDPLEQQKMRLSQALQEGDICVLDSYTPAFSEQMFSPSKAATLQAFLPGAGYWYVGLKKAAITSFVINTLFLAATYECFQRGYWAPALITLSLETGWYFGGINGAAIAANSFNEGLYTTTAKEVLLKEKLFPILRFEYAF